MNFHKYHGLGNDYVVLDPLEFGPDLDAGQIRRICHRNCGVGSDGILLGPFDEPGGAVSVRIFNPDGSEAEKSGNGLRIFARYLHDTGRVKTGTDFVVSTKGGPVTARVGGGGRTVCVEMGTVCFTSSRIPVAGPEREVINETLRLDGETIRFCAATIGNPHCVIVKSGISPEETRRLGPAIENHPLFPNRTNVQFAKILDWSNMALEIWERGAGYTLASGSSASAAAAVARRLGLCGEKIGVHMAGGKLDIRVDKDFTVSMTGPVTRIMQGTMHPELFGQPAGGDRP